MRGGGYLSTSNAKKTFVFVHFVVRYLYFTCIYCLGANAETESFTQSNILENIHNWKRVFALFGRDIITEYVFEYCWNRIRIVQKQVIDFQVGLERMYWIFSEETTIQHYPTICNLNIQYWFND